MKKRILFTYFFLLVGLALLLLVVKYLPSEGLQGARTGMDMQIGNNINASTANSVLYVDSNLQLAQDASLSWTSSTDVFATEKLVSGSQTASNSAYNAEFTGVATTSFYFGTKAANKGTCLQMKDAAGANVFVRINGTAFVINGISCR